MLKNKYVIFILFVAATVVVWNLLGILYNTVIAHNPFIFSPTNDLVTPLIFGCVCGYLFYLKPKNEPAPVKKKNKKGREK